MMGCARNVHCAHESLRYAADAAALLVGKREILRCAVTIPYSATPARIAAIAVCRWSL
jgi:hypothetical protein